MDWTSIIVALITATASVVTVVIQSRKTNMKIDDVKAASRRDAIRNQILLLIMSDRQNVDDGKLPENYKNICELYDEYKKLNGNSWIHDKVEDYNKFVSEVEKKLNKKGTQCLSKNSKHNK